MLIFREFCRAYFDQMIRNLIDKVYFGSLFTPHPVALQYDLHFISPSRLANLPQSRRSL